MYNSSALVWSLSHPHRLTATVTFIIYKVDLYIITFYNSLDLNAKLLKAYVNNTHLLTSNSLLENVNYYLKITENCSKN